MGKITLNYIERRFGPGETIKGVIKKVNSHGCTDRMLNILMTTYNELNGEVIPKPGEIAKIPVFGGFVGLSSETKEQLCGDKKNV